jgi:hypothetical protein
MFANDALITFAKTGLKAVTLIKGWDVILTVTVKAIF